jgi:hypothetical protein
MPSMRKASIFVVSAVLFAGGFSLAIAGPRVKAQEPDDMAPETVLSTYHVKSGDEKAFAALLARTWATYQKEKLVEPEPHIVVQGIEHGKPFFTEVFTWVARRTPDHAPLPVQTLWREMHNLTEPREGNPEIQFTEVTVVVPK